MSGRDRETDSRRTGQDSRFSLSLSFLRPHLLSAEPPQRGALLTGSERGGSTEYISANPRANPPAPSPSPLFITGTTLGCASSRGPKPKRKSGPLSRNLGNPWPRRKPRSSPLSLSLSSFSKLTKSLRDLIWLGQFFFFNSQPDYVCVASRGKLKLVVRSHLSLSSSLFGQYQDRGPRCLDRWTSRHFLLFRRSPSREARLSLAERRETVSSW